MSTTVVNRRSGAHYDVMVDRTSFWGNPFHIGVDGTRREVIAKYRAMVLSRPDMLARLPELRGKVLGCWCKPKPCHADVLAELADSGLFDGISPGSVPAIIQSCLTPDETRAAGHGCRAGSMSSLFNQSTRYKERIMAEKKALHKVTTPKFRASFAWVFKPQPPMEGSTGEPKYSITMLFDAAAQKTPQFEAMKKLAVHAAKEKFGDKLKPDGKGWFIGLRNPFRDGSEKSELEGYEGCVFAAATSRMQPGIVDQSLNRIISEDDFYSGCYARATITAYGYDKAGNKGVAFGLQNLQKLGDGERFSGRAAAEEDFDAVDDFVGEKQGEKQGEASFLD